MIGSEGTAGLRTLPSHHRGASRYRGPSGADEGGGAGEDHAESHQEDGDRVIDDAAEAGKFAIGHDEPFLFCVNPKRESEGPSDLDDA